MMLEQHNSKLRFLESKDLEIKYRFEKIYLHYEIRVLNKDENQVDKYFYSGKESIIDRVYTILDFSSYKTTDDLTYELDNTRKNIDSYVPHEYSDINSYFLNLYRILKFIYRNKEFNNNLEYSSLLRSFLSKKLLAILAYHLCDRDETYENYIKYINEFRFFEHVDIFYFEKNFLKKYFYNYTLDRFLDTIKSDYRKLTLDYFKEIEGIKSISSGYVLYNNNSQRTISPDLTNFLKFLDSHDNNKEITIDDLPFVFEKKHNANNYSVYKYSQPIFLYFIGIFSEAFKGNKAYERIEISYKNIAKEFIEFKKHNNNTEKE